MKLRKHLVRFKIFNEIAITKKGEILLDKILYNKTSLFLTYFIELYDFSFNIAMIFWTLYFVHKMDNIFKHY